MKPHRAAIILVYGILGLMLCQLFGIAAWSMGTADLKAMNDGEMDRSGTTSLKQVAFVAWWPQASLPFKLSWV
jgi:hypothetical protein